MNRDSLFPSARFASPRLARHPWPRRGLAAAAITAAAGSAVAVPVAVVYEGLPPGLSAEVTVDRNVCRENIGWISNPAQPLSEQSYLHTDPTSNRSTLRTRYVASFDTPPTQDANAYQGDRRCSTVAMDRDWFYFAIRIKGLDAYGKPAFLSGSRVYAPQTGPVKLSQTLSAATTSFTPGAAALPRGMVHELAAEYATDAGTIEKPRIELLRPLAAGGYERVASIAQGPNRDVCLSAGGVTQCAGVGAQVSAAGVLLHGNAYPLGGYAGVRRFRFQLLHEFPLGPLRIRATAEASDLPQYLIDGMPQRLDLLPWQAQQQDTTVQ